MKRLFIVITLFISCVCIGYAQNPFAEKLKKGEKQTVVVYGTSAAIHKANKYWVDCLFARLNKKYPNQVSFYNCSKSGIGSFWATENFNDSVLAKKTDVLIFGFSENDAVLRFNNWPWYSGRCAEYMIKHLRKQNKDAHIILYIMSEHPLGAAAETRPEIALFNQSCRETAEKEGVILADFAKTFKQIYNERGEAGLKEYQRDGILPTKKASNEVIIPLLWESLFCKVKK